MVTFLSKEETDHRVVAAEVAEVASLSISLEPLKPIANQSKATIGMELLITQEEMLEKLMKSLYKPPQEPTAQYSQLSASQAIAVHSARPAQSVPTSMDTPLARAYPVSTNQRTLNTTRTLKQRLSAATNASSGKALRSTKNA